MSMLSSAFRIRWRAIAIASVAVWLVGSILIAMAVFAYAFSLGWAARSMPDQTAIQQFAQSVGPVWGPRLSVILTAIAAVWVGRQVTSRPLLHAVFIGIVVVVGQMALRPRFALGPFMLLLAAVLSGVVGGWLGSRIKRRRAMT